MSCRDDADFLWSRRKEEISEEIELISQMYLEVLRILKEVTVQPLGIHKEVVELSKKFGFCKVLAKFASSRADGGSEEMIQEILKRLQDVVEKTDVFVTKLLEAHTRMGKEGQHWKDVVLKEITHDDLEGMTSGERKELLKTFTECRSIFNFGKVTYQDFQAEWDEIKCGLDQLVMEYMKELVVIAKGDAESNE